MIRPENLKGSFPDTFFTAAAQQVNVPDPAEFYENQSVNSMKSTNSEPILHGLSR
jgi:hypothetical protein